MDKVDYRPNLIASSLRSKKTRIIGLIIPEISDLLVSEMAKYLESILAENNYEVIISNSEEDSTKEIDIVSTLSNRMIDGLLVMPTSGCRIDLNELKKAGIPVVFLDRICPDLAADVVMVDNEKGCFEATEYLLKLGHKNIVYISHDSKTSTSLLREKGYKEAMASGGIEINRDNIIHAGPACDQAKEAIKKVLERKTLPSAIVAEDDVTAIGAIRGIYDQGLRVPEDISVVGFDDIFLSNFLFPRLTTIHYPIKKMAFSAAEILLKRIEPGPFNKPVEVILSPRLVVRDSTAKLS
jgi:LacI family transcriptional regulator